MATRRPRRPTQESVQRLTYALDRLHDRLEQASAWADVRRAVGMMAASLDGLSVDVQYAAILHLAQHATTNMIACPDPTP